MKQKSTLFNLLVAISVFNIKLIKISTSKPYELVKFNVQALQDYADNLANLQNDQKLLPDVESIEIFDNKHFSEKFTDFVENTIEKQIVSGSGDQEQNVKRQIQHIDLEIDLVDVFDSTNKGWWSWTWRKIKEFVMSPFRWLWHKAKASGLHLAIKFDGMLADFESWKTDFDLADYIPENFTLIGNFEVAFISYDNQG